LAQKDKNINETRVCIERIALHKRMQILTPLGITIMIVQ